MICLLEFILEKNVSVAREHTCITSPTEGATETRMYHMTESATYRQAYL